MLSRTDDAFLQRNALVKGAMTLIDSDRAIELHDQMQHTVECSGGSAANSMVGIAALGGEAAYIGKVRDDATGDHFRRDIREAGVAYETPAAQDGPPTGRCLILVTPDAQRTMQTLLGASATLSPEDIDESSIAEAAYTFLEGYLWDPEPAKRAFLRAAEIAHGAGGKVALTLSDPFCVERHREEFRELVDGHIDVLFANEHELVSLYRTQTLEQAISAVRGRCEIAAITRGDKGSVILGPDSTIHVEAHAVPRVVDTTGAGDLYAGGFLYGLAEGRDLLSCGRIGSLAAAEVIGHPGARPESALRELMLTHL